MLKSRLALAMTALAFALALPAAARADTTYVVQLKDAPLATYAGGTDGIPATSPRRTHRKLKADSAPGLDYRAYLARRQSAVLGRVRGAAPRVLYAYRYALSGFAAVMTPGQAAQLAKQPDVASVEPVVDDHIMDDPDTLLGGAFGEPAAYLRLTDPNPAAGLWARLNGPVAANGAGSGMIVGDIDTGIEPGHPSFADDGVGYIGDPYTPPAVWNGACQAGPGFDLSDCNHKLVGARFYVDGFGRANLAAGSFISPRDDDGHGTHTASTAAGNYGVHAQIDGSDFGIPAISGIAPRAYVASYKACWNGNGTTAQTGCNSADVVKAIDQAVADGVDVINMSIGSNTSLLFGPQEASLLNAAAAGVFVANSAGNAGPNAGTVGAPSDVPWTTSVAASSLARSFTATVTLSNGVTATGSSVTGGVGPARLVDGGTCLTPPAGAAGAIVLCLRDGNPRIAKSQQVLAAGGVGMILANATPAQELDTDSHWVPTVQVSSADGARIKAAIGGGTTTATLTAGHVQPGTPARVLAAFSSRGPQTAVPDIAKPDLAAPGVQILAGAASAPAPASLNRPGQQFAVFQGTSQAAPMVAGAGALLLQLNSALTPAEIKSELMTTANPVLKEDGTTPATPFDAGSGELDPDRAANAGLVLNATLDDYIHYLEFQDPMIVAGDQPKLRPNDLNLPSIAFSRFVGKDATTRTFTSVDSAAHTWTVGVTGLTGLSSALDVGSFTIAPGASQPVTLTLTRTTAPFGAWAFGALVLTSDDGRTLRLPISVKPVWGALTSPVAVSAATAAGSAPLTMRAGWAGALTETAWGLAAPHLEASGRRITATTRIADPSGNDPGTQVYPVTVPPGSQLLSARISNADAGADLDLFLYRVPDAGGAPVLVASSRRNDSNEQINVTPVAAGRYLVAVLGFTTPGTGGSAYDLTSWVLTDPTPNDLSGGGPGLALPADPLQVAAGDQPTRALSWSGAGQKGLYLGLVSYAGPEPAPAGFSTVSVVELTKTVTTATDDVGGSVPASLALSLGPPPSFGTFTPGLEKTYSANGTASVLSTAGDAALSVSDPSAATPGHLVNGTFALPSALQAAATSPGGTAAPTATVGGTPATLETWSTPVSSDPVTLTFTQQIGKTDALRAGSYGKTLTLTLTTTHP